MLYVVPSENPDGGVYVVAVPWTTPAKLTTAVIDVIDEESPANGVVISY
jgi:hypothetical protein